MLDTLSPLNLLEQRLAAGETTPQAVAAAVLACSNSNVGRNVYLTEDANAIRESLVKRLGFDNDKVLTLTNGDATRNNILALFHDSLGHGRLNKDDRVFVFFAGHGATRNRFGVLEARFAQVHMQIDQPGSPHLSRCVNHLRTPSSAHR